jgi:hypothetical protein
MAGYLNPIGEDAFADTVRRLGFERLPDETQHQSWLDRRLRIPPLHIVRRASGTVPSGARVHVERRERFDTEFGWMFGAPVATHQSDHPLPRLVVAVRAVDLGAWLRGPRRGIVTGHKAFDEWFSARSDDPSRAGALLTSPVIDLLLERFRFAELRVDGRDIAVSGWGGGTTVSWVVDRLSRLLAVLPHAPPGEVSRG